MVPLVALLLSLQTPATDLARARAFVLDFHVDSAARLLRRVLDPDAQSTLRQLATAWVLVGTVEYIGRRDSAADMAFREAVRIDPTLELGQDLALGRPEMADMFADEKLLRRYDLAGRPFEPPGDTAAAGAFVPPTVLQVPAGVYPDPLFRQGIEGEVRLVVLLDTLGRVDRAWVEVAASAHPGFAEPAIRAVLGLRARPATRGGRKVPALVHVPIRFQRRAPWRNEVFTARVPRPGIAHPPAPPPPAVPEVTPAAMLAAVRRFLERHETDTALGLAREILDPERDTGVPAQATAFVLMGIGDLLDGKMGEARGNFRVAVTLDPAQRADSLADLHGDLAALLDAERRAVAAGADTAARTPLDVDEPPEFVAGAPIWFPASLRRSGVEGRVLLEAVLDTAGRIEPHSIRILASPAAGGGLDMPAREFAIKARFRPARLHGQAVRVRLRVPLEFRASPVFAQGTADQHPEFLSGPPLEYPDSLYRAGISGQVVLEAILDTTGRVEPTSITVISSDDPAFAEAARQHLLFAHFRPARSAGKAVRVQLRQPYSFQFRR